MKSYRNEPKGKMDSERRREILESLKREREDRRRRVEQVYASEHSHASPLPRDKYSTASLQYSEDSCNPHVNSTTKTEKRNKFSSPSMGGEVYNNKVMKESFNYGEKGRKLFSDSKESPQSKSFLTSQKDSHMKTNGSFIFDKNSKLAQEIRRKYRANPLSYNKSILSVREEQNSFVPSANCGALKRSGSTTYMKPTASTEIRNSNGFDDLPLEVFRMVQKREEQLKKECTFQPELHLSQQDPLNKEERRARLCQPKTRHMQRREQLKRQKEDEELAEFCTFKPKGSDASAECKQPVDERLYEDASKRLERLREGYKMKELSCLKECTFEPNIPGIQSIKSEKLSSSPLYKRFKEVQRKKTQLIQRLRMENELKNTNLTFKPSITKRSGTSKTPEKPVAERLFQDAGERVERSQRTSSIVGQIRSIQYSFMPRLHAHAYSTDALGEERLLGKGFEERQELYLQRSKEQKEKYANELQYSFKPQISVASKELVALDPKRAKETQEEKLSRLTQYSSKQTDKVRKEREMEIKKLFTHHPQINKSSHSLARRAANPDRALQIELAHLHRDNECTFHPLINSSHMSSRYSQRGKMTVEMKERERRKAEKREQQRRDLEYEEMKACTFKPETAAAVGRREAVAVKGLGKHLEKRERKRLLDKELKEREQQVFGFSEKYDKREVHKTIPQPFNLSRGSCRAVSQREFTFQPETNEGRNKRFLKNLIGESSKQMPQEYTMGVYS